MSATPFRGTEALAQGVLTRARLRGQRYRRVVPDVYLPAAAPDDLATRSRAAYLLVAERGGVLAGYSAAVLLGADCAPLGAPAEVLVTGDARARPGLRVQRGPVVQDDVIAVGGCRVTTAIRTAWDLARRLRLVEAVVAVDALARHGGFAPSELLGRRAQEPGARGCRRLDEVVRLADPRAESPPETRLRVALVRAGFPRPSVQHEIADEFGFPLARVDLAYLDARLAIEYDGAVHFDSDRAERDRRRDADLAGQGWETVRLTRYDVGEGRLQTLVLLSRLLALRAPHRYGGIEIDRRAVCDG
ncbi:MAG: hypothetical protein QOG76_4608 [Pseudonocardiales bacterium]|nr:hypothetical protein [Pseudonocardiales bacterium]